MSAVSGRARALIGGGGHEVASAWSWGAAIVLVAELTILVVAGLVHPLLAAGLVAGLLYFALCWLSLPAAWLVAVAAVPFSREILVPGVSSALWIPTEPMIFVFLGVWCARSLLAGAHSLPGSPILRCVVALGLVAALSAFQSRFPILSVKAVANATWYLAFAFLFPYLYGRERPLLRAGFRVLAVTSVLFSLYGLSFIARHGLARWTGNAMGKPFFPEHGTYSAYLSFGLAALVALSLSSPRRWMRVAGVAAACTIFLAVVLSLTRAAYLGLVGLVICALWFLLRTRRVRTALVVLSLGALVVGGIARFREGQFVSLYAASIAQPGELSNLERISRWLAAWNMVRERPLLGVGYGAYEDSYYTHRVLTLRTEERFRRMGVHSEYFEVISEMGWIGFATLLWFLWTLFRQGSLAIRSAIPPRDRWLALGALSGLVSYLVHGLFNNYSGMDKLSVPFWFLVSAVAVLAARARESGAHLSDDPAF